jgi:glycerophosphoryl diester phosphodiesterase
MTIRRIPDWATAIAGALFVAACGGQPPILEPPALIAHAGGIGNHRVYTNSLEALQHSVAAGHTLVELDFSWTTDDRLVLVHDWDREFARVFGRPAERLSRDEFLAADSPWGITQMALEDLGPFLRANPDVRIVTDIKERNLIGLGRIAGEYPDLRGRFLPQIYHPDELADVRELGFAHVILTLYRVDLSDQEVIEVVSPGLIWAVTMPVRRALSGDLPSRLASVGVPVYAHTVNDRQTVERLTSLGVHGVYTDWLAPSDHRRAPDTSPWSVEAEDPVALDKPVVPNVLWSMDGFDQVLSCTNGGDQRAPVRLEVFESKGVVVGTDDFEIEAHSSAETNLAEYAAPGIGGGWMTVDGAVSVDCAVLRSFRGGLETEVPVHRNASTRLTTRGPGTGVSGLLLALVNPTDTVQSYRLERRIGDDLVDDQTASLEPGHQLIRVYRSATREPIEIVVSGGPVVTDTLRWDPMIRILW